MKKQFQSKSVPRGTRTLWRYLGALFILFTFAIGNVWAAGTALADLNFSGITAAPSAYTYSTTNTPSYQASQGPSGDKRSCMLIGNGGKGQTPTIESTGPKTGEGKRWMAFCPAEDCDLEIVCTGNGKEFKLYDKNHYNALTNVDATTSHVSKYTAGSKWSTWEIEGLQAGKWYVLSVTGSSSYVASMTFTATSSPSTDPVSSVSVSGATAGYATVPVELTATPNKTATAYKWFVDGVEQSGEASATFNFVPAAPGTYSIVAKARNTYNAANEWIASTAHTYTASKLCGELIKIVQNGQSDGNVSGILTGTKDVKLSSGTSEYDSKTGRKIGSDNYWLGVTNLSAPLRAGDVATIFVTTASAKLQLFSDKGTTLIGEMESGVAQGENEIVLNSSATGKTAIYLYRTSTAGSAMNPFVHSLSVSRSCTPSADCSISGVTINSESVTPAGKVYSYEVAAASALTEVAVTYSTHPLATASPASGFTVAVPAAGDPANTQTITVTAEDGTHSDTYTISVTKATAASDVVTLNELAVTGYTLAPAFDPATLAYTITKGYGTTDPASNLVTYTKTEEAQSVNVAYDSENHKFTVTVKAEDNTTTQDYVITINEAAAKRDLLEVLFSNGAKGAINASSKQIRVPYIGADAPTFVSAAFASWVEDGATAAMNEGKLKVIGADTNFDEYTIVPVQLDVTGVALGEDITFDGVPAYIFDPYGFDASKGVKFAKNYEQESNRRISSGNSRIYIAVPAGVATLQLTSGSQVGERNVVIKVNGETSSITKTAATNSAIELAMNPAIVNFVYIENNSGSGGGDGGFTKMHLVPAYSVTYAAGEGAVKSGEAIPTQVAVAAGTEITLAMGDALEKDGYDFDGWLCNIDAVKYAAGVAYTMTAAPTMFTAQWVEHIVPVDPTLTYNDGAYTTGLAALDLNSLIDVKESTGAITYSVKEANGTGAAIDGVNFTATAAGTAVITASQAAVVGFNAKSVDFNVVVTEPTEVDGIKMVVAGALTGNFVSARTLSNGNNTVEGIAYTKYITMSSTMSNFGNEVAPSATKGIYYYPSHKNIRFYFYVYNNQSSAKKIYIYTVDEDAEGTSDATSANVSVEAGRHMVYADVELTKHAAVVFGVENTGMQICQIVAVESGDALLQGGEVGYSIDYNKCYISPKANTVAVYDGIEYKLYADAKLVSASNVQLQTLGTHYIKFHLDATMQVKIYADNKKYYIGSECSTGDNAKLDEATGNGEFTLAEGDWYINGSGEQVKINKLEFALPKAETPTITTQPATKLTFDPGDMTATVVATVTEGTLHYQWYKKATVGDDEEVGTDNATLTTTTEGTYYVVVTNSLAGHQDVSVTSDEAELGYRVTNDATLMALSASAGTLDPVFDKNEENYSVNLAMGTTVVPTLTATATMNGYANVAKNEATEFVNYEAVSTVVVTSEDGTANKTYTVHFYVDHLLPQVDVTESTTWDWTYAAEGEVTIKVTTSTEPIKKNEEGLMANVRVDDNKPTNDATFNSQALLFYGENVRAKDGGRWYASLGHIKFNVTKPGIVEVEFSDNGSNDRCLSINGFMSPASSSKTDIKTFKVFVPAGEVTLMGMEGAAPDKYIRISKITYTVKETPDYTRNVSNNIGTLCVDHNVLVGGALGATFYQIASRNEIYNDKIDFEEVGESEELVAGQPYIFQSTTGRIDLFYGATAVTEPVDVRGMYGWFDAAAPIDPTKYDMLDITEENKDDILYISSNKLWSCGDLVDSDLKVVNNRAYIVMSEVPTYEQYTATPSAGAPRRRVTLGKDAEQVVTGVENLNASEQPVKLLINGQLFIIRGEKMFNANGQLVK